jgi:hypothetical protein
MPRTIFSSTSSYLQCITLIYLLDPACYALNSSNGSYMPCFIFSYTGPWTLSALHYLLTLQVLHVMLYSYLLDHACLHYANQLGPIYLHAKLLHVSPLYWILPAMKYPPPPSPPNLCPACYAFIFSIINLLHTLLFIYVL